MAASKADQISSGAAESWAGTAHDVAQSAAEVATQGAAYVQTQLGAMSDIVLDYIGKALGEWTQELQTLMSEHPFTGITLIITVGYSITVGYAVAAFMRR
jgi:hypothetical protein